MRFKEWITLALIILLSEGAGIIGSVFTAPAIPAWYATLAKPEFVAPNWAFAPVWTTLFLLMGIAAFLVWQKGSGRRDVRIALSIFVFQLLLNTLWSFLFFGLQSPGAALVEVIFLWFAILATMIAFARIARPTLWLLVPYIGWVSFAAYLNYSIWVLNHS